MANIHSPFGLVPLRRLDGLSVCHAVNTAYVPTTDTDTYRTGDAVVFITGSSPDAKFRQVRRATAADNTIGGVVLGISVEMGRDLNDTLTLPHEGNTSKFREPGKEAWLLVQTDREALYEIQEFHAPDYLNIAASAPAVNGETRYNEVTRTFEQFDAVGVQWNQIFALPAVTALAAADVGNNFRLTDAIPGHDFYSGMQLDAATLGAGPLELMWLQRKPNTFQAQQFFGASAGNALGQFAKWVVRISGYQF